MTAMQRSAMLLMCALLTTLSTGCVTTAPLPPVKVNTSPAEVRVDFTDALLNRRQVLLIGPLDERSAEILIQKLLYLNGKGHDPIDLYLQTPGGDLKSAMSVYHVMQMLDVKVNTYALSE